MPQQTINLGTAPNDGTGDPLRDAYDKCNSNFTELYAGLPVPLSQLSQSSATTGQVPAWDGSAWVASSAPVLTTGRVMSFDVCLSDTIGLSGTVTLASNGLPVQDSTDYNVYRCSFNPTSFSLNAWSVSCENAGATFGFALQYSTDLSSWSNVTSSTLNLNNTTSQFLQVNGSVAIGGSPSVVYFRLIWVNVTGNDRTYSLKTLALQLSN